VSEGSEGAVSHLFEQQNRKILEFTKKGKKSHYGFCPVVIRPTDRAKQKIKSQGLFVIWRRVKETTNTDFKKIRA